METFLSDDSLLHQHQQVCISLWWGLYIFQIFIFLKFQEQWGKHQLHSWFHKHVSEIHINPFLSLFLFLWDMIIDEVIEPQLILTKKHTFC